MHDDGAAANPVGPRQPARPDLDRRRLLAAGAALVGASLCPAPASALPAPTGPVVLTIQGRLLRTNAHHSQGMAVADLDMAMLERLEQVSFTTQTPWYSRARRFTGPLLRDVLALAGARGETLRLVALNNYRVDMPMQDCQRWDVIVARLLDDQPMAVRDKGPLFVIYPFDSQAELRRAAYYSRSAWQLRTIEVL